MKPIFAKAKTQPVRVIYAEGEDERVLRATPGWRAIPGQLTPNFNVKEFACKDSARTPYIQGLMREQGLSKKDAKDRAVQMLRLVGIPRAEQRVDEYVYQLSGGLRQRYVGSSSG